ncbi:MAG: 1-acyl-sn-glycerol-3-phosphate acyltransferase [Luteimonas sp.]
MTVAPPTQPPERDIIPTVPSQVPRAATHAWERRIGYRLLQRGGWHVQGELPDLAKAVVIGAPHSSNWDGLWVYFASTAMGLDIRILGKPALFKIPLLGFILRRYGGFPASQDPELSVLEQASTLFGNSERLWYGLAPEGTRKQVSRWKIGFWKIAKANGVPIVPVYLHYPDKVIGIGPVFYPSDDMRADIERLRAFYRPFQGKHHGIE